MAARAGLDTMAISDHDTLLSAEYCYRHPVQDGVRLIPATELTGYDYERKHRVHLLCYWPQDCPELRAHCDTMRRRRNECCLQSARELEALYPQFRTEQALEYAKDSGVLFKSGIMQALHELGLADSIYGEVYHYLFGWEPRGIVLHSPEYPPVEEVIATARAAKAVLVFAHPTVYKSMPLVRQLVAEGKLDGIEIDHPRNSEADKAECRALCEQYGLIVTGGTDFHGSNTAHPHRWAPAPPRTTRSHGSTRWQSSIRNSPLSLAALRASRQLPRTRGSQVYRRQTRQTACKAKP